MSGVGCGFCFWLFLTFYVYLFLNDTKQINDDGHNYNFIGVTLKAYNVCNNTEGSKSLLKCAIIKSLNLFFICEGICRKLLTENHFNAFLKQFRN